MFQRTACVDHIKVDSIIFSSILQIGDSQQILANSKAVAIQREAEIFYDNEGSFSAYSIFSEALPFTPVNEIFTRSTQNLNPVLKVRNIDIIGAASSSVIHLGNSCHISMEARVKHIRHLLPREELNNYTNHNDR